MRLLNKYCKYNIKSLLISKVCIKSIYSFPKFKKLVFFFFINIKQYKKNLLLFYIIINMIFGGLGVIKKKCIGALQIVKLVLKKKKLSFLSSFVNFYLPILGSIENKVKLGNHCVNSIKKNSLKYYRVNYLIFPVIPELDYMYEEYESVYGIVSSYRMQLDMLVKTNTVLNDCGSYVIRMYRLPFTLKCKKNV
jgi:hypothetical protein